MLAPAWSLRAASAADHDFLYALHRASMRAYVDAVWGWREDEQRRFFDERFDPERRVIIHPDAPRACELAGEAAHAPGFAQQPRALCLYERLGFRVVGQTSTHILMRADEHEGIVPA